MHPSVFIIGLAQALISTLWLGLNLHLPTWVLSKGGSPLQIELVSQAIYIGLICSMGALAASGQVKKLMPKAVIYICAILAAVFSACLLLASIDILTIIVLRLLTGVCVGLSLIYSIKLSVTLSPRKPAHVLAWILSLCFITQIFPFAINLINHDIKIEWIISAYSITALFAAVMVLATRTEDYSLQINTTEIKAKALFQEPVLRAISLAIIGHAWQLFGLITVLPIFVGQIAFEPNIAIKAPLIISAAVTGFIALGILLSGDLSKVLGAPLLTRLALAFSGWCCLVWPQVSLGSTGFATGILLFWGLTVAADLVPLLSMLRMTTKAHWPQRLIHVLCLSFITAIVSSSLILWAWPLLGSSISWLLLPGPIMAIFAIRGLSEHTITEPTVSRRI